LSDTIATHKTWEIQKVKIEVFNNRPSLPYLTSGVGRLLHLPTAEAVSVRPNARPWM